MTVESLLDRATRHVAARVHRQTEVVQAVHDTQLWEILASHGLLEQLDAGTLTCYVTRVPLTRENIGGLLITAEGPKLVADTYAALAGAQGDPPPTLKAASA